MAQPAKAAASAEGPKPKARRAAPPSTPNALRRFAAQTLDIDENEVWGLNELAPADWDVIWARLELNDPAAYREWYDAQKRPMRQELMASGQSPRKRDDRGVSERE